MACNFLRRRLIDDVLHMRVLAEAKALFVELLRAYLINEDLENPVYTLIFFDQFLVLTATLDGVAGLNEQGHLFEDLERAR
jgi:hypothetical protein